MVRGLKRLLVLCLDSVPPTLLFGKLLEKLPNFRKIYENGTHGVLRSCHPPITVPAWMVMMTGKNPGRLGIYGFRHRRGSSYNEGYIVNSTHVKEPCVWDVLAEHGLKACVVGLPPSYPPKTIHGNLVSCMITPSAEKEYTYPLELKREIQRLVGEYTFDVPFRMEDRDGVKRHLFEMTERRFKVAEYLANNKSWDLFILHEIGFDRLHHAFWKFFDEAHPKYVKGNKYERIAEEYYSFVDERVGSLLSAIGEEASVLVLSDHGSKAMQGAFAINQWLEQMGFVKFVKKPDSVTEFDKAEVDWSATRAWGWGGYYARIFFNVKGREPQGVIPEQDLPAVKKELKEKIMHIRDPTGRLMQNVVFEPEEVYGEAIGDKPDLMVYFNNLDWRSAGTVGHETNYLSENDTGPDDSVHSMDCVFMFRGGGGGRRRTSQEMKGGNIIDIGPTILRLFDIRPPSEMEGRAIDLD